MKKFVILAIIGAMSFLGTARAALIDRISYTAEGAGLSIDAVGLNTNDIGSIRMELPVGASIYKAYLYSASVWSNSLSNVVFEGQTLVSDPTTSRVDVGARDANPASENRWDVTSIVKNKAGSNSGLFSFSMQELGTLDGELLAVLYNVPNQPVNTAFIFDGELATTGDSVTVNLTEPINLNDPTYNAIMSLGISFGYQPTGQYSQVDINGQRLTTSAGGQDDGFGADGGLITAGGIGDDTSNPADPYATGNSGVRYDDELYTLNTYLVQGASNFTVSTRNPSNDDNIFFMGLVTRGKGSIEGGEGEEVDTTGVVPEPASLFLLGSGLLGLAGLRRKKIVKS